GSRQNCRRPQARTRSSLAPDATLATRVHSLPGSARQFAPLGRVYSSGRQEVATTPPIVLATARTHTAESIEGTRMADDLCKTPTCGYGSRLALALLAWPGQRLQRSTNAFSITKWPGSLLEPSRKPRALNISLSSSSIAGLPHIMTRAVSISPAGRPAAL